MKKLRTFLYGREFVLQTDHQPLTYLKQARFLNDRVTRWALYLQNYHMKIEMVNKADFLSRMGGRRCLLREYEDVLKASLV